MTVTNHVYADIALKQDALIRKALDGSVFQAAMTVALPPSLTIDGEVTGTPTLYELDDADWTEKRTSGCRPARISHSRAATGRAVGMAARRSDPRRLRSLCVPVELGYVRRR